MGVIAGVGIYSLMPQSARDTIANAVLSALGQSVKGLSPEENVAVWQANAEAGIYNALASIFNLIGDESMAAKLSELARGAASKAAQIMRPAFTSAFMDAWVEDKEKIDISELTTALFTGDPNFITDVGLTQEQRDLLDRGGDPFDIGASYMDSVTGAGGKRSRPKQASGLSQGIFAPLISGMKAEVQTGMTEVNEKFTTGFTDIGTQIDTSTLDVGAKLLAFSAGVLAAVPSVLTAFGALAISVGIGMNALLLVVTTYANLIIAKWNEMLMTLGAAPTMMGYSPDAYAGAGGVVTNTTNVYVTTDKPARLNDSLLKAGTSVYEGASGVRKVTR